MGGPTVTLTPETAARDFSVTVTALQSDGMSGGGAFYSARFVARHLLDGQVTAGGDAVSVTATVTDSTSGTVSTVNAFSSEGSTSGDFGFTGDCGAPDPNSDTRCQATLVVRLEQTIADGGNWSTEVEWGLQLSPSPFDTGLFDWEATVEEL